MSERIGITSYPLYWPHGRPRAQRRSRSAFRDSNVYRETQEVRRELELLGARQVIVSTNLMLRNDGIPYAGQKQPTDPGVAVWFDLKGVQHALACDAWDRAEDNLRAIAKHVEAMRGQLRWKVATAQEAFAGFRALPEKAAGKAWWDWLEYDGAPDNIASLTREEIEKRFRELALKYHPDRGGAVEDWLGLQQAREQALGVTR